MAQLTIENLTKVFINASGQKIRAVDGVNLVVQAQELMMLLGPSGSGKTTLLRLIAGLEQADSGTIALDGAALNKVLPKDRDIAMVFQNYALYPHMSVFENLALGLKLRKIPRPEIERRVFEIATMLQLNEVLERNPQTLSGGQRQRVALGRALARKPKLILLDEPLSGLDARLRSQMRAEISRLQKSLGLTMLYVTHDQAEAMSLGNRIAVLHNGRVEQVSNPRELYLRPSNHFVANFIGTPAMNFFSGKLVRTEHGLFFQQHSGQTPSLAGFSLRLPDQRASSITQIEKPLLLGIRPENIQVSKPITGAENQVEARTERIEMLGAETHLHFDLGTSSCVARVAESNGLCLDQKVSLIFQMSNAHFFDPVTGQRIDA